MLGVVPIQSFRVAENGSGFFERHAVLLEVAQGFSGIPREHITVYTLIWPGWEAISLSRAQLVGGFTAETRFMSQTPALSVSRRGQISAGTQA